MAKSPDKAGPGRPKGRKPTETIFVRISPSLAKRFGAIVDAIRPKTSLTAVVTMLIEDYVAAQDAGRAEES